MPGAPAPAPYFREGTRLLLAANNLLDEEPPFINDAQPTLGGYDPANADPTGRFVSLSLTKEWRSGR